MVCLLLHFKKFHLKVYMYKYFKKIKKFIIIIMEMNMNIKLILFMMIIAIFYKNIIDNLCK